MSRLYVIGIGYRPLDKKASEIIYNSSAILASSRLLELFKGYEEFEKVKDRVVVINNVDETIDYIRAVEQKSSRAEVKNFPASELLNFRPLVLLASGDPMFFGIGGRLINEFGKEIVEIYPDLSSIQVAFSRIKETWGDAFFLSLHGGPDPAKRRKLEYDIKDIPVLLIRHRKVAILTDRINNPVEIAKVVNSELKTQNSKLKMYVCEKLGYHDEKIIEGSPEEIAGMEFSEPNVVVLVQGAKSSREFDEPG